eukprot:1178252-Prymnesium_polylepis.1
MNVPLAQVNDKRQRDKYTAPSFARVQCALGNDANTCTTREEARGRDGCAVPQDQSYAVRAGELVPRA